MSREIHREALIVAALVAATFVAYLPALSAGFVWDDNDWLTENPAVTGEQGWSDIWTGKARLQYYPVLFSAWRVMYALWGLNPAGYHAVNILLHAVTAVLLGFLCRRFQLRAAWWIAAVFALHPMHVESVAWVTELKNVLSGGLVVGSVWAFVVALDRERVDRARYALALLLFVAAVLTKTAVATVALVLPLLLSYRRERFNVRDVVPAAPFIVVGTALGWVAVRLEQGLAAVVGTDFAFGVADRLLIGTHAFLFYPLKLLIPYPLIFNYPRWDLGVWHAWVWPAAALAVLAAVTWSWKRGHRAVPLAVGVYALMIAPALGVFDVYAFRYSFVADHFAYLASIGVIALAVGTAASLLPGSSTQKLVIGTGIVVALGVLTWNQSQAYQDRETLWLQTLERNPDSWLAHHSLALEALDAGQLQIARKHFDEAIRCKPEAAESWTGRALLRRRTGNAVEALSDLDRAVELSPGYPQARLHRGTLRVGLGEAAAGIEDLDLFLAANPLAVDALTARAEAYARLDLIPQALADLDAAIAAGGPPDLFVKRGFARVALGDLEGAAVDAQRALQIRSLAPPALELQGAILLRQGDEATACEVLRRACELGSCRGWLGTCEDTGAGP